MQASTSTAVAAAVRDANASTAAEEMLVNAKSRNRRPKGMPSNAYSAPRCSGRPANAHSAPTTVSSTATQSTPQQSTSGIGAQKRKTSTALRGSANLTYKRPRQKKQSENTDRVLHSPTLISSVPINIDLGFKPNGLRYLKSTAVLELVSLNQMRQYFKCTVLNLMELSEFSTVSELTVSDNPESEELSEFFY
ncbi:hypothetical protein FXO38_27469 [Capsicum annuum]|uniref:Uncharacterized protein n=1 Tax=Capsicum annuum TaxID=4072 RepID=A0A2G2ZV69_CAPAN|nr:hypothetical protein FXO38_27469 [Capsicum annuum]PHT85878.1 hypothetical protein T459_07984 [Capsicum annuum]